MAKQSRLDINGIQYRAEKVKGKNKYASEVNVYDENNESALAHEGSPLGKGTGKSMGYAVRDLNAPKTQMNYSVIDTTDGPGGEYDKNGTIGVEKAFQGNSGRNWAKTINPYSNLNEYGVNSVDIDTSVSGQFVTK